MRNKIKKVIIWGYPLNSHTHSYIHYAFKKGFEHLGFETLWLTDNDSIAGINFDDCLFIAASEQEKNIPLNKSSYYVLHNVDARRYYEFGCKILLIQTHNIATIPKEDETTERFNKYTLFKKNHDVNCLYMCWGTDLLPNQIDINNIKEHITSKYCLWIGTYGDSKGEFQNGTELIPFFDECKKNNIEVKAINPWSNPVSFEENYKLVNKSYLSPSIQGPWQINNGYIPCRIFKNISYGHLGITNNINVDNIFDNTLIYDRDPIKLFYKSIEKRNSNTYIDEIKYQMNEVKTKHTYINRIEYILKCLPD